MDNRGIGLIWITVSDIKKAIDYYSQVLGFQLAEFHEAFGWAELEAASGARLGLAQANPDQGMKAGTNAIITITVDDIVSSRAELEGKGVSLMGEIMEIPGEVKLQLCADKDGNQYQLVELLK